LAFGLAFTPSAHAQTFTVSTTAELQTALADPSATTILMRPGSYEDISIERRLTPVTIRPSGHSGSVTVRGWVYIFQSEDVAIEGLTIDPRSIADFDDWRPALGIVESDSVTVRDLLLDGHLVEASEGVPEDEIQPGDPNGRIIGYPFGTAIWVRQSSNVEISQTDVSDFRVGGLLQNSVGVAINDASFTGLRTDGLRLEDLRHARITNSRFQNFRPWFDPREP
jgi:hypothetical protein